MSRIKGRDTKPEMLVRRGLHARGLRYKLHDRRLPGTPDLVFRGARAVIFVHGCYWHGHACHLGVRPHTNSDFWAAKISQNAARDERALLALSDEGWRTAVVWECALRGPGRLLFEGVLDELMTFLRSPDSRHIAISEHLERVHSKSL